MPQQRIQQHFTILDGGGLESNRTWKLNLKAAIPLPI